MNQFRKIQKICEGVENPGLTKEIIDEPSYNQGRYSLALELLKLLTEASKRGK